MLSMLSPLFSKMPSELTQLSRWVVWRGAKVPYCSAAPKLKASSTAPETWSSFEQAQTTFEEGGFSGIGFVLNNDGIVGIDLDKCVIDGQPLPAAIEILDRLGCTYIEFSPSGNGLRSFGYAPATKGVRGKLNGINVELYSTGRYLTVTGQTIKSAPLACLSGFVELADALRTAPTEEVQKNTEDDSSHLLFSSVGVPLQRFIPNCEGARNQCLFQLARYLKGTMPDASKAELRLIVRQWHELALPIIGTKDFSTSWADFLRGYEKVKFPYGATLNQIMEQTDMNATIPESLQALGYGEKCNLLVRICRQLQLNAGAEPFFLSARQAGELLGIHFTDAAKYLYALKADGVLELVSLGAGNKASRYRYVWPE